MNTTNSSKTTAKAAITNALSALGWIVDGGTAVARKQFATAVGEKSALAYLQDWGSDVNDFTLTGDYQSEGRNALAAEMVFIPKNASGDQLERLAMNFAAKVDSAVSQTYAVRLMH